MSKRVPSSPRAPSGVSRRNFIRGAAGAAGAGVVLGSALWTPATNAQFMPGAGDPRFQLHTKPGADSPTDPTPIPKVFFFPGPPDTGDPCVGRDQSVINNFNGFIGATDISLKGRGTDLTTGESHHYLFHGDMRFMKGDYIGVDGLTHQGAFIFI